MNYPAATPRGMFASLRQATGIKIQEKTLSRGLKQNPLYKSKIIVDTQLIDGQAILIKCRR
jgi:hypothetical protein